MAATVSLLERNGASPGVENTVSDDLFYGAYDGYIFNPGDYPIIANNNSYEKYNRLYVSNMGGMSKIDKFKVYISSGSLGSHTSMKTNARTTSYGGAAAYATPVQTASAVATQNMPTSLPGSANLGIGGSLSGEISSAPAYSDYLVTQVQLDSSETVGKSIVLTYSWDETP